MPSRPRPSNEVRRTIVEDGQEPPISLPQAIGALNRLALLRSAKQRAAWVPYTEDGFRASWKKAVARAFKALGAQPKEFIMTLP